MRCCAAAQTRSYEYARAAESVCRGSGGSYANCEGAKYLWDAITSQHVEALIANTVKHYFAYIRVTDDDITKSESANPVKTLRMRYDAWKKAGSKVVWE